jgi:D-alanyl-D-alanine carboxypeptidase
MLAMWLRAMLDDPRTKDAFFASLAQAGEEGTLRRRFRARPLDNDVRAKTGYLSGVSAISGYVTDSKSGRRLIFAILTNDKPNRVQLGAIREAEERIIQAADQWVSGKAAPGAAGVR